MFKSVIEKYTQGDASANLLIPVWPSVVVEFLAFALLAIVLLKDCIQSFYAIFDKEMAEEIEKDWV